MINHLKDLLHKLDSYFRLPLGTIIYVRKCEQFPEGTLGKIISYNSPQREYHITTVAQSKESPSNPYILESEDGFKVLEEEFENGEFIKYNMAEAIDLEPENRLYKFISSPVGLLATSLLIFCTGGLVALEFVR